MLGDIFDLDERSKMQLRVFALKYPVAFRKSVARVLNNAAFGIRDEAITHTMPRHMQIRNKGFLKSHLRVFARANPQSSVSHQEAVVGSAMDNRFSGWQEQETGVTEPREAFSTIHGRKGSTRSQIDRKYRLDKVSVGPEIVSNRRIVNEDHRLTVFLAMLAKENYKKPFKVFGGKKIQSGIYKFKKTYRKSKKRRKSGNRKAGELQLLQSFRKPSKRTKPVKWLTISYLRFMRQHPVQTEWQRAFEKMIKK